MSPPRHPRPGFSRRAQYGLFAGYVVAALGVLLGAVLLLVSTFHPPAFAAGRAGLRELTTPVSTGLSHLRDWIWVIPNAIGRHFTTEAENQRLRAELKRAAPLVQRARLLNRENARLQRLLDLREREAETVATARLVNSSAASTRRFATLNAGTWQGVRRGQPVRGPEGLVGRIVEIGPNTASVLLLTDPNSIVPVRRTRDGLPGIVAGRGDGTVDVRSAGIVNAPFFTGDLFVTSGTGGIYPPGVPVARVLRNARDVAEALPLAQPNRLDYAIVQKLFLPEAVAAEAPRKPAP